MTPRTKEIVDYLREQVKNQNENWCAEGQAKFGVSRQYLHQTRKEYLPGIKFPKGGAAKLKKEGKERLKKALALIKDQSLPDFAGVAEEIGVTKSALVSRIRTDAPAAYKQARKKIQKVPHTEKQIKLSSLIKDGRTIDQIASEMKVDRHSVVIYACRMRKQYGEEHFPKFRS